MTVLDEQWVQDFIVKFKQQFARDFPFLPYWEEEKVYAAGALVYYENAFYTSLLDDNTAEPTDLEAWEVADGDVYDYVSDEDIERALYEALAIFPSEIFENEEVGILALLYLTAHYLCEDLRNAQQGINSTGNWSASSKTVRNVSESYVIPSYYSSNPLLNYLSQTGYGQKYLSLYWPRTIGRVRVVGGWTLA